MLEMNGIDRNKIRTHLIPIHLILDKDKPEIVNSITLDPISQKGILQSELEEKEFFAIEKV